MLYTLDSFEEVKSRIYGGTITPDEAQAELDKLVAAKETILPQLAKKAKVDLVGKYWAGRLKKPAAIDRAWRGMLEVFLLGRGYSFGFGEDMEQALIRQAREACGDMEAIKAFAAARKERINFITQAATNPQTLEEFNWLVTHHRKGEAVLTQEQQERYDALRAGNVNEQREREKERAADLKQFSQEMPLELHEGWHTQKAVPVYVVSLTERVDREVFRELRAKAKKLGGWWSRYNKDGAIPGFLFYEKVDAETFMSLAQGDASALDRWERREQQKQSNAVLRFRDIADRLERGGDKELERERLENTPRRVRMAQSAESRARDDKALAGTLRNLADAIEAKDATHLDKVRFMSDVLTLERVARQAQYLHAKAAAEESGQFTKWDEIRHRGPNQEDIYHAAYPMPSFYLHSLETAVRGYHKRTGFKLLCRRLQVAIDKAKALNKTYLVVVNDTLIEDLRTLISKGRKTYIDRSVVYALDSLHGSMMDWIRLQRMDLTGLSLLREALREYLLYRYGKDGPDPVVEAERALVGLAIPGFFPTPVELAMTMAPMAEIGPEDRVLEPSAGSGRLADAIRTVSGVSPDCCEVNYTLRELLELKGHNLVASDFLRYQPDFRYDAIVGNPPFSGGEDVKHFHQCVECLAPGGRLVIIMGIHPFIGSDLASRAFRRTLERPDLIEFYREELPAGTFETTNAPAMLLAVRKAA